ncbi:Bug family tripartite tricarboxylate transporter substrate binding protein [Paracandidimonas soli]|nr:tripartite tricarboxylate transporter substrate binding protein [Paracandidimonas soli]
MKRNIQQPTAFRRNFMRRAAFSGIMLAAMASSAPASLAADDFPKAPVKVIVTYPPGGGTDVLARIIGPALAKNLGQPVVIENRGGAGGSIGSSAAARSPKDGYTMLFMSLIPHTAVQGLYASLNYDPISDFSGVSRAVTLPYVIVANSSLPVNNLNELIEMAKSKPGSLRFESAGIGSSTHLIGELFKNTFKVDITHVPYKGGGPGLVALLGGEEVQVAFENLAAMLPHIQSGKLKALAVTSKTRSPQLPDVPTVAELGTEDFVVTGDFGYLVPAGTPKEVIAKLNSALVKTMADPEIIAQIRQSGAEAQSSTPEELDRDLRNESSKWLEVIKGTGIKAN